MLFDDNVIEAIKKRASGFYYSEEQCEYETKSGMKYLLCKNNKRVYFKSGYLKIKIKKLFSASARIEVKIVGKIFQTNSSLKYRLKSGS